MSSVVAVTPLFWPALGVQCGRVTVVPAGMLVRITIAYPVFTYEIHGPAAGVVLAAVATPVVLLGDRDVQIRWRRADRCRRNDHRSRCHQGGRRQVTILDRDGLAAETCECYHRLRDRLAFKPARARAAN